MTGTGPLIRPMTPADRPALANFPDRVSAGSAIFRFHGSLTVLTDQTLNLLLDLVDGQREAITAVDDRGIAGVARFARDDLDPAIAEVAILVADEWQHRGLARQLLRPLAEKGSKRGNRTVPRRDPGGQHRRAALLPRIDSDRARAAQERRRGRAHQRSGTTSHAGLTFARAPSRTCGAPILAGVAGTQGENVTAAGRTSLPGKSAGRPRSANACAAPWSGFTTRAGRTTGWLRSWNRSGESPSPRPAPETGEGGRLSTWSASPTAARTGPTGGRLRRRIPDMPGSSCG